MNVEVAQTTYSIGGQAPTQPCVFASCDSIYFWQHAASFIYSAATHGNNVHLHLMNPDDSVFTEITRLSHDVDTDVTWSYEFFDLMKSFSADATRTYYACNRFLRVCDLINCNSQWDPIGNTDFIILDIDCIVRKKLEFPKEKIGLFLRPHEQPGMQVAAGIVTIQGIEGYTFIKLVADMIKENKLEWFLDQHALHHIYTNSPVVDQNRVYKYDINYMDWEFDEERDASIWTGKGPRKDTSLPYLREKSKYLMQSGITERFWRNSP
jgi:hypothetical protein